MKKKERKIVALRKDGRRPEKLDYKREERNRAPVSSFKTSHLIFLHFHEWINRWIVKASRKRKAINARNAAIGLVRWRSPLGVTQGMAA